jgi:hypothetical protein
MSEPIYRARGACFSACGRYRYLLTRTWDPDLPRICWIMLNPSTADAEKLDPTNRRCLRFSQAWGYGGMAVVNLFALRATNPGLLYESDDPCGPDNLRYLQEAASRAGSVMVAWGAHGTYRGQSEIVRALLSAMPDVTAYHLGLTKGGQPRHPLYVPAQIARQGWLQVS